MCTLTLISILFQMATSEKPLVMILDSLDQLSKSHNAHDLTWLPKQLPAHVYLIVSTLRYEHDILETLKANVSERRNFVEVMHSCVSCSRFAMFCSHEGEVTMLNHTYPHESVREIRSGNLQLPGLPSFFLVAWYLIW